jgi:hypothetical protein
MKKLTWLLFAITLATIGSMDARRISVQNYTGKTVYLKIIFSCPQDEDMNLEVSPGPGIVGGDLETDCNGAVTIMNPESNRPMLEFDYKPGDKSSLGLSIHQLENGDFEISN